MRMRFLAFLIALGVVLPAAPALAQRGNRREQLKVKIKALRARILTEDLQLDTAAADKLVPVLSKYDDEMARLLVERNQLRRQLRDATGDKAINDLIDKLVTNQQARWATESKRFVELRKLLTPQQTARLMELLPELDRRILRSLRGARRHMLEDEGDDGDEDDTQPLPRRPRRRAPFRSPD